MSKVSSDSAFENFVVSLTESHTSHEWFFPLHGLYLSSLSNWGKTALTKWSLRLLAFLKPIIGTSKNTLLWAWFGVSKRCNSLRIFLTFSFKSRIISQIKCNLCFLLKSPFPIHKIISVDCSTSQYLISHFLFFIASF